MFKPLPTPDADHVDVEINGVAVKVAFNLSVAAALLQHNRHCRTTVVSATERGPFCMMGVCFDCLIEINGVPNQQACMRQVEHGMEIRWQLGAVTVNPVSTE